MQACLVLGKQACGRGIEFYDDHIQITGYWEFFRDVLHS